MSQLSDAAEEIKDLLSAAICAWRSEGDASAALSVRSRAAAIRAECQLLYERLSKLAPGPGDAALYVNLLLVCKHLERILRHVACVAEQAADAAGTRAAEAGQGI